MTLRRDKVTFLVLYQFLETTGATSNQSLAYLIKTTKH